MEPSGWRSSPLIQSSKDLLDKLPRLKDAAFQTDVGGYTKSLNAYLKQKVDQVLSTTTNRISLDTNALAQLNLSNIQKTSVVQELAAAFVNEVGDVKHEAGYLDSVLKVLHLHKKLYRLVDYWNPPPLPRSPSTCFPTSPLTPNTSRLSWMTLTQ